MNNSLSIKINQTKYNLSSWHHGRFFNCYGKSNPDYFRSTEDLNTIIGLRIWGIDKDKYEADPKKCRWHVFAYQSNHLDSMNDFSFIVKWYKETYGSIYVNFEDLKQARNRIDGLFSKFENLAAFI